MLPRKKLKTSKRIGIVVGSLLVLVFSIALVCRQNIRNYRQTVFVEAALRGNVSRMKLLLAAGANVNEPACQTFLCPPPIVAAAFDKQPDAVRLLLDRGADVNSKMK